MPLDTYFPTDIEIDTDTREHGTRGYNTNCRRWGVILAGGDGKRLLPLTCEIANDDRPKQFCAISGGETLLDQTRARVGRIIAPKETLFVLTETQETYYAGQMAGIPAESFAVQPYNRGTAPAILYSLMRIAKKDPKGIVAIFPSDHHIEHDEALAASIDKAFSSARSRPVLLGIVPDAAEPEYGWIEPDLRASRQHGFVFRVSRFWEKPSPSLALALMKRGCLWNSFIMAGRVEGFLNLFRRALPNLVRAFEAIRPALCTAGEKTAVSDLYAQIAPSDFSREVLCVRPNDLDVLLAKDLGWSDLGDPDRVLSVLERKAPQVEISESLTARAAVG